jgi:glycosyltransferase involved in cell wall biosynthesis
VSNEPIAFSIIIPTYNSEKTIRETLRSITEQTFRAYEVIIMDGLSRDATLSIVGEFAAEDPRIRVISEKDGGIYDAMNKGMVLARGEWVYFSGSDDYIVGADVLGRVNEEVKRHPKTDMFYGNVIWGYTNNVYAGKFTFQKLLADNICHQSIFIRRTILLEFGPFNTAFTCLADWDLNLKLFKAHRKIRYMNMVIAYYHIGGTSYGSESDPFRDVLKEERASHNGKLSTRVGLFVDARIAMIRRIGRRVLKGKI